MIFFYSSTNKEEEGKSRSQLTERTNEPTDERFSFIINSKCSSSYCSDLTSELTELIFFNLILYVLVHLDLDRVCFFFDATATVVNLHKNLNKPENTETIVNQIFFFFGFSPFLRSQYAYYPVANIVSLQMYVFWFIGTSAGTKAKAKANAYCDEIPDAFRFHLRFNLYFSFCLCSESSYKQCWIEF